jgi:hypothetical protein
MDLRSGAARDYVGLGRRPRLSFAAERVAEAPLDEARVRHGSGPVIGVRPNALSGDDHPAVASDPGEPIARCTTTCVHCAGLLIEGLKARLLKRTDS